MIPKFIAISLLFNVDFYRVFSLFYFWAILLENSEVGPDKQNACRVKFATTTDYWHNDNIVAEKRRL